MEMCHSNASLSLYGMGDTPVFIAKKRCVPSNMHLPLVAKSETRYRNTRLPFIIEATISQILNKLRRTLKQSIFFSPSIEPGVRLGDADASHFFISETMTFRRVFNLSHI
jgi:hypothetical protein